jgi:dihydrolipoamide dehydrogenase
LGSDPIGHIKLIIEPQGASLKKKRTGFDSIEEIVVQLLMHNKLYDVVVFGAGTAGLSAISEIKKVTNNFLLINEGKYGTTCARVGCMPSKTLIQVANEFYAFKSLSKKGIKGSEHLKVNSEAVMKHVRSLRDRFVKGILEETHRLGSKSISVRPRFLEPNVIEINKKIIRTKQTIIATGTTPQFPLEWNAFVNHILTTDQLFEQDELPKSMATLGLGPVGIEMGQALHRLGVKMIGIGRAKYLASLSDPVVNDMAKKILGNEFSIECEVEAKLSENKKGLRVSGGKKSIGVEKILASLGRQPNLKNLGLEDIGVKFDKQGIPAYNKGTLKLHGFPIFLAGDVNDFRPVLHEAADEGKFAGINSLRDHPRFFKRRVPMTITFCEPNIATVGQSFSELSELNDKGFIVGKARLNEGRSIILSQDGLIRIYGEPKTGILLGAEMIAPQGEHLAHFIASLIHRKMTVFDALKLPFYHPVIEEGLQEALENLSEKVRST